MTRKSVLIVGTIIAAAALASTITFARRTTDSVRNAYALETTQLALIRFMEENDGEWPTSWVDLRPFFEAKHGNPLGFIDYYSELQDHVRVNWSIDVRELLATTPQADKPHLKLVSLKHGSSAWKSRDPNGALYEYLEGRRSPSN